MTGTAQAFPPSSKTPSNASHHQYPLLSIPPSQPPIRCGHINPSPSFPSPHLLSQNLQILYTPHQPHSLAHNHATKGGPGTLTLLRQEQPVPLLQRHAVAAVLVVWREARRVRGLGHLAAVDLLQRVDALARRVEGVHEMHLGGCSGSQSLESKRIVRLRCGKREEGSVVRGREAGRTV